MNSAVRYASDKPLVRLLTALSVRFSSTVPILLVAAVVAGLSVIYVANQCRDFRAELQNLERERQQLQREATQLLLEKSTMTRQSRIQQIAKDQLNMITPEVQAVVDILE